MTEYIEREAALRDWPPCDEPADAYQYIRNYPAADVRPVVLCGVCELHGHCYTEDVFAFARLAEENRFCAVGKVKTNVVKKEES
jgi:hypothetical protein